MNEPMSASTTSTVVLGPHVLRHRQDAHLAGTHARDPTVRRQAHVARGTGTPCDPCALPDTPVGVDDPGVQTEPLAAQQLVRGAAEQLEPRAEIRGCSRPGCPAEPARAGRGTPGVRRAGSTSGAGSPSILPKIAGSSNSSCGAQHRRRGCGRERRGVSISGGEDPVSERMNRREFLGTMAMGAALGPGALGVVGVRGAASVGVGGHRGRRWPAESPWSRSTIAASN